MPQNLSLLYLAVLYKEVLVYFGDKSWTRVFLSKFWHVQETTEQKALTNQRFYITLGGAKFLKGSNSDPVS